MAWYKAIILSMPIIDPNVYLLTHYPQIKPGECILLIGVNPDLVHTLQSGLGHSGELWIHDHNFLNLKQVRKPAWAAGSYLTPMHIIQEPELPEELPGRCSQVLMVLPKGRQLGQRWVRLAWDALLSGGSLYLSGPKAGGIQPLLRDADQLFGGHALLGYKKGHRIARFRRPADLSSIPDWFDAPGIAAFSWQILPVRRADFQVDLLTLPGVFSGCSLDPGTAHLLDHLIVEPDDQVLDLGCGSGVIGLYAADRGACSVDLVDSNLYAIASSRENLSRLNIHNGRALVGDATKPVSDRHYSLIVTNPPFHTGLKVDTGNTIQFITQASQRLLSKGRFILVANHFLPYEAVMEKYFRRVHLLYADGRYKVIQAQAPY